jgi:hypothetical protein
VTRFLNDPLLRCLSSDLSGSRGRCQPGVRWVVERTFAWLHHFKRLLVRYDRRAEIHEAFLAIACCLVCFRRLQRTCDFEF